MKSMPEPYSFFLPSKTSTIDTYGAFLTPSLVNTAHSSKLNKWSLIKPNKKKSLVDMDFNGEVAEAVNQQPAAVNKSFSNNRIHSFQLTPILLFSCIQYHQVLNFEQLCFRIARQELEQFKAFLICWTVVPMRLLTVVTDSKFSLADGKLLTSI